MPAWIRAALCWVCPVAHQEDVVVQCVPAPLAELKGAGGDLGAVLSLRQPSKESSQVWGSFGTPCVRAARCGAPSGPPASEQAFWGVNWNGGLLESRGLQSS